LRLLRLSIVSIAAALLVSACATVNLPAITDEPTSVRLPGKVVWHDLISDNPEASARFYSELFGWEFEPVGASFGLGADTTYTLIRHNGRLIGGMVDQRKLAANEDISQWMPLISVTDIQLAATRVKTDGGTVLTPPTELADRGWLTVVSDQQGALMALVQTRDGDPVDRKPGIGDFLWNELWTDDVDKAAMFYRDLFGYDKVTRVLDDDLTYNVLNHKGKPRAGLLKRPIPEIDPVWVAYIRVADPAPILERVEELGGRILVEAREREIGGQVALIAGPSGAGIAIQTWDGNPMERNQ